VQNTNATADHRIRVNRKIKLFRFTIRFDTIFLLISNETAHHNDK